jgi:hypothetical protein
MLADGGALGGHPAQVKSLRIAIHLSAMGPSEDGRALRSFVRKSCVGLTVNLKPPQGLPRHEGTLRLWSSWARTTTVSELVALVTLRHSAAQAR